MKIVDPYREDVSKSSGVVGACEAVKIANQ